MLQHFAIVQGAALVGPSEGPGDSGNLAFQVIQFLCHGRDMLAFIFLLGLIDARSEATFGPRDAAALMTTLIVTFLLNPTQDFLSDGIHTYPRMGSEWFLYVYLWSRLVLILLSCISPGWWQPCLVLFAACLVPDDVDWLQIPLPYRDLVANHTSVIWIKGFRWAFLFAPGMYLLSWHAIHAGFLETSKCLGRRIMSKASDHLSVYTNPEVAEQSLKVSFCLGCFAFYWAAALLSSIKTSDSNIYLTGMPSYRHGFQTLYVEGGFESTSHVSHSVSWEYMTHPSLLRYVLLWICEVLLFALPTLVARLGVYQIHRKFLQNKENLRHLFFSTTSWSFEPDNEVFLKISSQAIAAAFAYVPYHFKTLGKSIPEKFEQNYVCKMSVFEK